MEKIRFIHTADIHLDKSFTGQSLSLEVARRKREAIRKSFARVVEAAKPTDALIVAGDLFEKTPRPDTVNFTIALLGSIAPTPVYITPGNHDPYSARSPYAAEDWPENVHIFTHSEPELLEHPSGRFRIMGFAHTAEDMTRNVVGAITPPPPGSPVILIAHVSILDAPETMDEPNAPCKSDDFRGKNFSYAALGHYHHQIRMLEDPPAWYPGAPEPTKFKEIDRDGFLEVTLDDSGVEVTCHRVAAIPYKRVEVDCTDAISSTDIAIKIEEHAAEAITQVRLVGQVSPEVDIDTDELTILTADKFINLAILNETHFARDYEQIARQPTSAGEFVRELSMRMETASDEGERRALEFAREYGLRALEGRELRIL